VGYGRPPSPDKQAPPEYLCWQHAVKDQMLVRGYISDNWHFPDAEFQQIVEGIRRLKPACDELATASAANNMASMQEIDEAVLQLVKDCGKTLANSIRTNNPVPPPGSGVPPAQGIVRPMLLPLNAPPQCQWSIATAVVPNAGPVGQNALLANAPGPAQNVPAPAANPPAQNIGEPPGPADPEAQSDPPPPGPANRQPRIGHGLGNLYRQKNAHQPANIPGQIQSGPSMGILGTPLGIKHAPANPPGPINQTSPEDIPVQIQSGPSMGILGIPLGIKHAPANPPGPINLPGPEVIPVQIQSGPSMGILGTPLGIKHAPANPPGPINLPGQEDIPVQIQADTPMGILGTPLGIKHAPANPPGPINLPGQEDIPVQIQADTPMGILGTPLGIKHASANPPGPINLSGQEDIPVQIQADPPIGILGTPLGIKHAPAKSPRSNQSARPRRYPCANPSGSPNGYCWEANGDATCSSGGYPGSRGTERGGSVDSIL